MSIWGKIGGAAAGLALGGPIGALVGALAGHYMVDRNAPPKREERKGIAFTIGVIALSAKMAKADGVVTEDEISAFREVFHVPQQDVKNVARVFNLAKQDVRGYEAYAIQLKDLFKDDPVVLEDVLDGLFHIAKADGIMHEAESGYLESVAMYFGFSEADYGRIRARHVTDHADPYVILGIDRSMSNEAIKAHYRKLVSENHPDRLIARGVPEEFVTIATEKIAAINAAYDQIEKERGI